MLVEDFVYSGTLSIINPYSPVYHVVESDTGGMIPASLKAVLSQWGTGEEAETDRPKVISNFNIESESQAASIKMDHTLDMIKHGHWTFWDVCRLYCVIIVTFVSLFLVCTGSLHQSNGSQSYGNSSLY